MYGMQKQEIVMVFLLQPNVLDAQLNEAIRQALVRIEGIYQTRLNIPAKESRSTKNMVLLCTQGQKNYRESIRCHPAVGLLR